MKLQAMVICVLVALSAVGAGVGATSAAAAPCSNESIREEQRVTALPDCRAYEQVSPVDKNGGVVAFPYGTAVRGLTGSSPDGNRVLYTAIQSFAGASSNPGHSYRGERSAAGWRTTDLSPDPTGQYPNAISSPQALFDATPDLLTGLTVTGNSFHPLDQNQAGFSYGLDIYRLERNGSWTWISRGNEDVPATAPTRLTVFGRSADFSDVVFTSFPPLIPEDTGRLAGRAVYERAGDVTGLLSVDAGGQPLSECGATVGAEGAGGSEDVRTFRSAVSSDGSRIVMTTPDPQEAFNFELAACQAPATIWVRDGGQVLEASASQRAIPDPGGSLPAQFQGATEDGSKVFFTSAEALTDDAEPLGGEAAPFLYEYDVASETLSLVTPNEPGGAGPNVSGVVGLTPDASHVYFVTGEAALWLYANGSVTPVASAPGLGQFEDRILGIDEAKRNARFGSDGTLLFGTRTNITSFDSQGKLQLYRFRPGDPAPICISCNTEGRAPLGDAGMKRDFQPSWLTPRNLLADGRVFFETQDNLVPRDSNATWDVYAWSEGEGARLLSDGSWFGGSGFVDASADGRDVFFATANSLVGWDIDNGGTDIYDVRSGGGFPEPPPPAVCQGDGCQAPPAAAPASPATGSSAFAGPGDRKRATAKRCAKGRKAVKVKGKVRCVKPAGKKKSTGKKSKTPQRAGKGR